MLYARKIHITDTLGAAENILIREMSSLNLGGVFYTIQSSGTLDIVLIIKQVSLWRDSTVLVHGQVFLHQQQYNLLPSLLYFPQALSQAPPTPTNLPVRRNRGLLLLKVIGGVGLFSCVVYITGRTVVKYLSS